MVLLAYACAAFIASLLFMLFGLLSAGLNSDWSFRESAFVLSAFSVIAAVYAAPVAVPVIVISEWRKVSDWRIFFGAGALLGIILSALFTEVPYRGINLLLTVSMLVSATAAATAYWFVAWVLFRPHGTSVTIEE